KLKALAREVLKHIDELFRAQPRSATPGGTAPTAEVPQMVRDVASAQARTRAHDGQAPRGTILVVDDNDTNRDLLARRLLREGHTVVMAINGREALERIQAQSFDLILLDIIMPEVNGFQVLEKLKADPDLSQLPVLMLSAYQESESVAHCVEMGADDYLYK